MAEKVSAVELSKGSTGFDPSQAQK